MANLSSLQKLFEIIIIIKNFGNEILIFVKNEFDLFSVKTVYVANHINVGHLQREIPLPTKYWLSRGATVKAVLSTTVVFSTFSWWSRDTMYRDYSKHVRNNWNNFLLDWCRKLVIEQHCEPKDEVIIGTFLQKRHIKVSVPKKKKTQSKNIRVLFRHQKAKNRIQDRNEETDQKILIG